MNKITRLTADDYLSVANKKRDGGDYLSAIGLTYTALKMERSFASKGEACRQLAELYYEMGENEASNKFWFKCLALNQEDLADVYEGMVSNFMAMGDFLHAGYYFNLLVGVDQTRLQGDVLGELAQNYEVVQDKKKDYYVVYPEDKVDYTIFEEKAKKAMATGDFQEALEIYQNIPPYKISDNGLEELTMCCYVIREIDFAIKVCKDVIVHKPNNLTALCNLCSLYGYKKDKDKSKYYYQLAKQNFSGSINDCYKIADCAIETLDDPFVCECVGKIIEDNPEQSQLIFPYGISLLNTGDYENAYKQFNTLCRLFPYDIVYGYYANYARVVLDNQKDVKGLLPFGYKKQLPQTVVEENQRKVRELFDDLNKVNLSSKREENKRLLKWALYQDGVITLNNAVLVLCTTNAKWGKEILFESLTDVELSSEAKERIVYSLILSGYRGSFKVVANRFFLNVKGVKIPFEDKPNSLVFLQGYAYALSKLIFWNECNTKRLVSSAKRVYDALSLDANEIALEQKEVAALIIHFAKFEKISGHVDIGELLRIDSQRMKHLIKLTKGEDDD